VSAITHYSIERNGKGKRPRDPNQLAKWIVEQSTAEPVAETPIGAA
jgi:hypothetical protein